MSAAIISANSMNQNKQISPRLLNKRNGSHRWRHLQFAAWTITHWRWSCSLIVTATNWCCTAGSSLRKQAHVDQGFFTLGRSIYNMHPTQTSIGGWLLLFLSFFSLYVSRTIHPSIPCVWMLILCCTEVGLSPSQLLRGKRRGSP